LTLGLTYIYVNVFIHIQIDMYIYICIFIYVCRNIHVYKYSIYSYNRDAELEKLVDANSVFGRSIRRDYFLQHSVIHSPTGQLFQKLIPSSVKWLFDPILALLFDFKLVNLDTEHFKQAVRQNVGEFTFQEAFDKTGRIINITVAPSNNYDPPRLLNYLTAPHVCIW
jgi:predicted acylesterase/phospholipase RssA